MFWFNACVGLGVVTALVGVVVRGCVNNVAMYDSFVYYILRVLFFGLLFMCNVSLLWVGCWYVLFGSRWICVSFAYVFVLDCGLFRFDCFIAAGLLGWFNNCYAAGC